MKVKLAQAALIAGVSRTTVHRAMKDGRITFERDATGERIVDVAELERVFGLMPPPTRVAETQGDGNATVPSNVPRYGVQPAEILAVQLEAERAKVAMLEDQVRDLQRRLDAAEQERRQVLGMLEAAQPPRLEDRSWWWRRWTGR